MLYYLIVCTTIHNSGYGSYGASMCLPVQGGYHQEQCVAYARVYQSISPDIHARCVRSRP